MTIDIPTDEMMMMGVECWNPRFRQEWYNPDLLGFVGANLEELWWVFVDSQRKIFP